MASHRRPLPSPAVALTFAAGFGVSALMVAVLAGPSFAVIGFVGASLHCFDVGFGRTSVARSFARAVIDLSRSSPKTRKSHATAHLETSGHRASYAAHARDGHSENAVRE